MRFNENRIDFYNAEGFVNGISIPNITKITCGLAEIYVHRNEEVICSIPYDNCNDFYVEEVIDDRTEQGQYIHKWLKREVDKNLEELCNRLNR